MMINPRKLAVNILTKIQKDNAYSNLTLSAYFKENEISAEEKAFVTALVYGVLDRKITLDYVLSRFMKTPIKKTAPFTLNTLRTALYQIMYMDKVPESAAVNEAVKLIKKSSENRNQGFVNAVLREVLRQDNLLPEGNDIQSLSVRYSAPVWLVETFLKDYGEQTTIALLEESLKKPPFTLKVNTLKTTTQKLKESLEKSGVTVCETEHTDALILLKGIDLLKNSDFKNGHFHIEDMASQKAISVLSPKKGERVLDICAAPGGKTFTMAEIMQNEGEIIACDLYEQRVSLIADGADRLGIDIIKPCVADATEYNEKLSLFDAVLCDVPCSGLGVIRRKPDIKYNAAADFTELEAIQRKILRNAVKYLKKDGRILYSTCTLRKAENENMIKDFLAENKDYSLITEQTLMPHINNTDGFYYALIEKH